MCGHFTKPSLRYEGHVRNDVEFTIALSLVFCGTMSIWAASWQNQQCAPSEASDQPGHSPSLIRAFTVRTKKAWVLSYSLSAQRRVWSYRVNAQAILSLRWAHSHCVGFVKTAHLCADYVQMTIRLSLAYLASVKTFHGFTNSTTVQILLAIFLFVLISFIHVL